MAILGNKKVVIPQRPSGPAPDLASRKEGVPFHNLFNFSGVRTPGKSITSVLEKPVHHDPRSKVPQVLQPKISKNDLGVIRDWVAMEEKIIHTPGPVQKATEKKNGAIRQSIPAVAASKQGASSHGFFNFLKARASQKDVSKVQDRPVVNAFQAKVLKTDPKAVASWVAMEERIVHDPKVSLERVSGDVKFKKIKIVGPQVPPAAGRTASKEKASSGGLFSFLRPRSSRENPTSVSTEIKGSQEAVVRALPLDLSKAHVAAVKNWVVSEEEAVLGHREQKTLAPKDAGPEIKSSSSPSPLLPQKLSPRTNAFPAQRTLSMKEPVRDLRGASQGLRKFLWVSGWIVAGVFMFFYVREISLTYKAEQRSSHLQNEKYELEQSYAALKNTSDDQAAEMVWLRSQLQDMTWELKGARADIVTLQNTVRTKDEIALALKAQTEALEKIVSQQAKAATVPTPADPSGDTGARWEASAIRGQITSINDRQGFVVTNVGSSQGIRSGQWVMIARFDKKLGFGRIDRAYPTMSVAKLRDPKMFQVIREGDSVYFS